MRLPAFPINIRQSWKGLPERNNLTYYEHFLITATKRFITMGLGHSQKIQLFADVANIGKGLGYVVAH